MSSSPPPTPREPIGKAKVTIDPSVGRCNEKDCFFQNEDDAPSLTQRFAT